MKLLALTWLKTLKLSSRNSRSGDLSSFFLIFPRLNFFETRRSTLPKPGPFPMVWSAAPTGPIDSRRPAPLMSPHLRAAPDERHDFPGGGTVRQEEIRPIFEGGQPIGFPIHP